MTSSTPESPATSAWGIALTTLGADGSVLDAWYPSPQLGDAPSELSQHPLHAQLSAAARSDEARGTTQEVVVRTIDLAAAPADAADAYLRLHLLSHRLVRPNEQNLEGLFGQLTNVVWTSEGPCAVAGFEETRLRLIAAGRTPTVLSLDKFPRMVDYVLPTGVRIGDADRVRLGAHLAEGTTVMHEGFVNFNAGTLGASMVEGRISQGVVVGDGSDVGGGASTMAPSPAAAPSASASAGAPSSAPRPGSASRSETTAWSRRVCTSPPAPRSSSSARRARAMPRMSSRRASCPACRTCCSVATR